MMSWSPPTPADEQPVPDTARAPTVGDGVRSLRALWRPSGSRASMAPVAVRVSHRWWLVALCTGVAAVAVSAVAAWQYHHRTGVELAGGVTASGAWLELAALLLASIVVARLRAGDDWARTVLALAGGLVALLSALTAASHITFLTSTPALFRTVEAMLRLLQAAAAGLGIWYMFQSGAARHFDPRRGE
jgi:hypothetical protein